MTHPTRTGAVLLGLLLALTGCSGGGPIANQEAKDNAVARMVASDNNDIARYCDLSVDGQGDKQAECLAFPLSKSPAFTQPPEADRVEKWRTPDGKDGLAVRVKTYIKTNSEPQWEAVGLLNIDGRWLVETTNGILGDPDAPGALTEALNNR